MYNLFCPHEDCSQHKNPESKNFKKKGKTPGYRNRTYQRFQCKTCGRKFTSRQLRWESSFNNPEIVQDIFLRYTGGTTMKRIAEDLDLDRKTVFNAVLFLGKKIEAYHYHQLKSYHLATDNIAFDEMESYVGGKAYPVSIGVAVCGNTQRILDIRVAEIRAKGTLKQKLIREHEAQKIKLPRRFFARRDRSPQMCKAIMKSIESCVIHPAHITTDEKRAYITLIRSLLPTVEHHRIKSKTASKPKKKKVARKYRQKPRPVVPQKQKDALQRLNSVEALLRTYSSRLHRRSMIVSKSIEMLQASLFMNLAYMNHYVLKEILNFKPLLKEEAEQLD